MVNGGGIMTPSQVKCFVITLYTQYTRMPWGQWHYLHWVKPHEVTLANGFIGAGVEDVEISERLVGGSVALAVLV